MIESKLVNSTETLKESHFHDILQIPTPSEAEEILESDPSLQGLSGLCVFTNKYNSDLDGKIIDYMIGTMLNKELRDEIRKKASYYLNSIILHLNKISNDFDEHDLAQVCSSIFEEEKEEIQKCLISSLSILLGCVRPGKFTDDDELFPALLNIVVESADRSINFFLSKVLMCFDGITENYYSEVTDIIINRLSSSVNEQIKDALRSMLILARKEINLEVDLIAIISSWSQGTIQETLSLRILISTLDFYPIVINFEEINLLFTDISKNYNDLVTASNLIARKFAEFSIQDVFDFLDNIIMALDDFSFSQADAILTEISDFNPQILLERPQIINYICQHVFDASGNTHMYFGLSSCFFESLKGNKEDIMNMIYEAIDNNIDALEEATCGDRAEAAAGFLLTVYNAMSKELNG